EMIAAAGAAHAGAFRARADAALEEQQRIPALEHLDVGILRFDMRADGVAAKIVAIALRASGAARPEPVERHVGVLVAARLGIGPELDAECGIPARAAEIAVLRRVW